MRARAQRTGAGSRRRLFPVFLAASAALHAVLLGLSWARARVREAPAPQLMQVVLAPRAPALAMRAAPAAARQPRKAPRRALPGAAVARWAATPAAADQWGVTHATADESDAATPAAEPEPVHASVPEGGSAAAPRAAVAAAGGALVPAGYLIAPAPPYPPAARRGGEQGTVLLRVLVTREGAPARVEVEASSGSTELDATALETVRHWRFVPARQDGTTIDSWVLVPIVFRLEG